VRGGFHGSYLGNKVAVQVVAKVQTFSGLV
jgi:hypothetical protein